MIDWDKVVYRAYLAEPKNTVWHYGHFAGDRLDNLAKCLGAAALEYMRLRFTLHTVFGWPMVPHDNDNSNSYLLVGEAR